MPQARADLSEMFPNGDEQAFRILGRNYVNVAGMIRPINGHVATPQELVALEYLLEEWDYSWDLTDPVCGICKHSLKDNAHGFDQNDGFMDGDRLVFYGTCTYCKICFGSECETNDGL